MAKIRSISPNACESHRLGAITDPAERLYWRLQTHCDDQGRAVDDPRVTAAPENIVTVPLRGALTMGGLLGDWRAGSGRVDDGQAACREAFRLLRQGGSQ